MHPYAIDRVSKICCGAIDKLPWHFALQIDTLCGAKRGILLCKLTHFAEQSVAFCSAKCCISPIELHSTQKVGSRNRPRKSGAWNLLLTNWRLICRRCANPNHVHYGSEGYSIENRILDQSMVIVCPTC
jgi:hypothetical protein